MYYTPFGEFFRTLRVKHHEVLFDASKFLGVSSAYVSSVETGKRPVPEEWIKLIANHYHLNEQQVNELRIAVEQSKTVIKINLSAASMVQRTAAIQFQRSFDEMDDDTAQEIIKIIKRNNNGGL